MEVAASYGDAEWLVCSRPRPPPRSGLVSVSLSASSVDSRLLASPCLRLGAPACRSRPRPPPWSGLVSVSLSASSVGSPGSHPHTLPACGAPAPWLAPSASTTVGVGERFVVGLQRRLAIARIPLPSAWGPCLPLAPSASTTVGVGERFVVGLQRRLAPGRIPTRYRRAGPLLAGSRPRPPPRSGLVSVSLSASSVDSRLLASPCLRLGAPARRSRR